MCSQLGLETNPQKAVRCTHGLHAELARSGLGDTGIPSHVPRGARGIKVLQAPGNERCHKHSRRVHGFPWTHAVPATNSSFLRLGGSCSHGGHVWGEETGAEMGRHLHKVVPSSGPALGSPISLDAALSTQGGWWPAMEVGPEAGFVLT